MSQSKSAPTSFSLTEAREIVTDLFVPNPVIYWTDFLLTMTVGFACFAIVGHTSLFSPLQIIAFIISCLAYYRAAMFIHELTHLRQGTFTAFRCAWNLLCGIPFLLPSFLYYSHLDHHRRNHYGTERDGEYLALGRRAPWLILWHVAQSAFIPLLAVVRFLLLTPLSWLSPRVRRWMHQRASSLVLDPSYIRPLPGPKMLRLWRLQEFGCFCYLLMLIRFWSVGRVPGSFPLRVYLTAVAVVLLNELRTLVAHRFVNEGREMTFLEQLLDSINYPRWPWLTELWAPVGERFHALHHLFPTLPYHALPEAHRRLMAQLPADSPYRRTESPGLVASLSRLWKEARQTERPASVPTPPFRQQLQETVG